MTRDALVKKAIALSWFTIVYNLIEGVVSIWFGLEHDAIALAGFGGDSLIEVSSATLVLWRFREQSGLSTTMNLNRERTATLGIGCLFILLAAVTLLSSVMQILSSSHPDTTLPGVAISLISLSFMFYLWTAKKKVATALDSATMMKDADCSLACIKLSAVLFLGSLVYLIWPALWWSDAAAAILLSLLIGSEGVGTIKAARAANFSGGCCPH